MRRRVIGVMAVLVVLCGHDLEGQRADSSALEDLRIDGNGVLALTRTIGSGFAGQTTAAALTWIAQTARLNVTFDPHLGAMSTRLSIAPHDRSAAAALLEVARESRITIRVSSMGQIVVLALSAPAEARPRVTVSEQKSVELPVVRSEAPRTERQEFDASARMGSVAISGAEVRSTPSFVEPDVLRAVQLLSGIEARSDWSAGFNVRGGEADQNLVLLDGYPIFDPFHLGGIFSTFIPSTVGRVELRTGGMPVQFDGRLSGSLDVRSADPVSTDLHGTADVSLLSSSASVGKAFDDGVGSWIVAARRTYADFIVDLFKPNGFPYHFQDIQGHLTHSLGAHARISITAYDGLDVAAGGGVDVVGGSWGNSVVGATIAKTIDDHPRFLGAGVDSITLEQRASITRFAGHVDFPNELLHVVNSLSDLRAGGNITAHGARVTQTFGYELSTERAAFHSGSPFATSFGDLIPFDSLDAATSAASLYVNELWRARPNLFIETGLRLDDVRAAKWTGLLPRLSVKYLVTPTTAFTVAAGSYAQWVHSLGREEEPVRPLQFWVTSNASTPVSRASDATLGIEHWFNASSLVHVEAFTKRYADLLTPNPVSDPRVPNDEFVKETGTSYGVDLLVRQFERRASPFSGWISYSYGVNTRVRPDGTRYFPIQDRRHNLNLVGAWHVDQYTWGTRVNVGTGLPTTPVLGEFVRDRYDPSTGRWVTTRDLPVEQNIPAGYNSSRLPYYARADVSVSRSGRLFGLTMSPYMSVVNVLNFSNPAGYLYTYTAYAGKQASFPNLPLMPTFGVNIVF